MKMVKILKRSELGTTTRYIAFTEVLGLEVEDKFKSLKLNTKSEKFEGVSELFMWDKWENFVASKEPMVFEIFIG